MTVDDSYRLTWYRTKWQTYSNLTGMCARTVEVLWIFFSIIYLSVPCDFASGLIHFCLLHILLRLTDLLQFGAQYRHSSLYKNPLNTIEKCIIMYSKWRFWVYCASYAYGRWVLLQCQRCVSPIESGTTWWLSPSWASSLGVVAHIFIWVDTIVWLIWLGLERIPWIKSIIEVEPIIFGSKDSSSADSTLDFVKPHRSSVDNLLLPTPQDSIENTKEFGKSNFSPV